MFLLIYFKSTEHDDARRRRCCCCLDAEGAHKALPMGLVTWSNNVLGCIMTPSSVPTLTGPTPLSIYLGPLCNEVSPYCFLRPTKCSIVHSKNMQAPYRLVVDSSQISAR